jgi:exonuclease III
VKCGDVLAELLSSSPDLVLLQETKLPEITNRKLYSFLPHRLYSSVCSNTNGSSGSILIAWTDSILNCISSTSTPNTLSVHLESTSSDLSLFITNVYAPSIPEHRLPFLYELKTISPPPNVPWMLSGDFNMIRYVHEKNNSNFQMAEAKAFNDCINDMCLIEVPLLDRSYT